MRLVSISAGLFAKLGKGIHFPEGIYPVMGKRKLGVGKGKIQSFFQKIPG